MKGKNKSIFDHCNETRSQEIFLQRCSFAQPGLPPNSDPSAEIPPPFDDSESDSVIPPGYEDDLVESQPIRMVSPEESVETVDLDEEGVNRTVVVESGGDKEGCSVSLKKLGILSPNPSLERKKLKIPVRDVVKAIVMNSKKPGEEDKEIEKTSCVQILKDKGFKFPGM